MDGPSGQSLKHQEAPITYYASACTVPASMFIFSNDTLFWMVMSRAVDPDVDSKVEGRDVCRVV